MSTAERIQALVVGAELARQNARTYRAMAAAFPNEVDIYIGVADEAERRAADYDRWRAYAERTTEKV